MQKLRYFNQVITVKKSLYRKIVLLILIACFILLSAICLKLNVFEEAVNYNVFNVLSAIFNNSYFSGISCSIIAVVIIYIIQLNYSKGMLKKDICCSEIIVDIYFSIDRCREILNKVSEIEEKFKKNGELLDEQQYAKELCSFYNENECIIESIIEGLASDKNDLLIDSVQMCFLINLNFKLLNIMNGIKGWLLDIRTKYNGICKTHADCKTNDSYEMLIKLQFELSCLFDGLKYISIYWKQLLDYLNYDPTYIKLFMNKFKSKYSVTDTLNQPFKVQRIRFEEINKEVLHEMLLSSIHHFWDM